MSVTPGVAEPSILRFVIRITKLGISILYFAWGKFHRIFSADGVGTCVILYYHSVPGRYRDRFEDQMRLVASRKTAIDISRIDDLPLNSHSVGITFDDALQSFVDNAVPVLVNLKIPATVFAVADALGSNPGWGEGYYAADERVTSAEQLSNLPDQIKVGSHTLTHPNLTTLSQEAAGQEIKLSRDKLESLLGRPVTLFSFPHGAFNDSVIRQCQEAGYKRVFTTQPFLVSAGEEQFVVGRVSADPWDWQVEFYLKLSGAYCWQPYAQVVMRKIRALFSSK